MPSRRRRSPMTRSTARGQRVMKDPRDIILAPVVSEKSYALMEPGVYTFKVPPERQQARDPRRRRGDLGRRGAQGQHAQPQGQEPRDPRHQPHGPQARHQAGHRHAGSGRDPAVRELRTCHGASVPANQPAPAVASRPRPTSPRSPRRRPRSRCSPRSRRRGGRNATAARPRATAVAATSSATASSTSSASRTA